MKFTTVKGNICDRPNGINTIIHQANTQGVMGAGVALALKTKWPEVEKADQEVHERLRAVGMDNKERSEFLLGLYSRAGNITGEEPTFAVYNLYGQELRRPSLAGAATSYDAVIRGFRDIIINFKDRCAEDSNFSPVIGIPHLMGCGIAGGDWDLYELIIKKAFEDTRFPVVFVDFNS